MAALVISLVPAGIGQARDIAKRVKTLVFERIADNGITPPTGDDQNSYAWSMAWFNDELYVGTARNVLCVERATGAAFPGRPDRYVANPHPTVNCTPNRYDLDLRAEIWKYNPGTEEWTMVFKSENDVPIPPALDWTFNPHPPDPGPGKFVARDIGFRGMVVIQEGRQQALYVGGVTSKEYMPGLPAEPRILRTTDGVNFEPVEFDLPDTIDTLFGPLPPMGFRSMVVLNKRLFVGASGSYTGDGVLMELVDPGTPQARFVQRSPNTMAVFELANFNGDIYVGTGDYDNGYSVFRTNARQPDSNGFFSYTPIVTDGAGRGKTMASVVAMHEFRNRLYVSASGFFPDILPPAELIRISRNDSWQLVVGDARDTPDGLKTPISGFSDSFENPFNAHFWRLQQHENLLYVGTNDSSWLFGGTPIVDAILGDQYGFDLLATFDGRFWYLATQNGFGDRFDFGARTMASTRRGLFVGSANHADGASVLQGTRPPSRGPSPARVRSRSGNGAQAPLPPDSLTVEQGKGATIVSWEPSPNASQYRVYRATYRRSAELGISAQVNRPSAKGVNPLRASESEPAGSLPKNALIAGEFELLGKTKAAFFRDTTAKDGVFYVYYATAEGAGGATSDASNRAPFPSEAPVVDFDQVQDSLGPGNRRGARSGDGSPGALVAEARTAAEKGDLSGSRAKLQEARRKLGQKADDDSSSDDDDLEILLSLLDRRIQLAESNVIPADNVVNAPRSRGRSRD